MSPLCIPTRLGIDYITNKEILNILQYDPCAKFAVELRYIDGTSLEVCAGSVPDGVIALKQIVPFALLIE
jgi:hypothetical protein